MPPIHLLIKPASSLCNLNCTYCFYHDISDKREIASYGIMEDDTIKNIIKKALDYAEGDCTIAYQGGEPTLAGLDFFKKTIEYQNKYNHKNIVINNAIQTNATTITDEWAEFFHDNKFLVGVSLDGSSNVHDTFRVDKNKNGTFTKVMDGIKILQKHAVDFNILTVVNSHTAKQISKVYRFFKTKKFEYMQFITCLDPLGEALGNEPYSLSSKAYGDFLCTLFDMWYEDIISGNSVHIRQFENYIEMILGYPPESCGMSGICSFQHVIEANGDVYPCDFYVLDKFRLGNLCVDTFEDIQSKRHEINFIEESALFLEECKSCKYFPLCRGGCKRYREFLPDGTYGMNNYCESYKLFFSHAEKKLFELARRFSRR